MSDDIVQFDDLNAFLEDRMRVYLAGPLTANDPTQAAICLKIRIRAERVLRTRFTVYDPADVTPPGTNHTADEIFNEDHTRTSNADLVFFHVNAPSLGVGIESQIAAEATIPRVIAHPKGITVSRMFDGVFNPTIARIEYADAEDFERQLLQLLPQIARAAHRSAEKRRPALEAIRRASIGRDIFRSRVLLGLPIDALAEATDIRGCMLRRLERDDAVASTMTLAQLKRIATELKATLAIGGDVPCLQGPADEPHVGEHHRESLLTLHRFVCERKEVWIPDKTVFKMWTYAFPLELAKPDAARGDDPSTNEKPITTKEWREIHSKVNDDGSAPTLFDRH